MSEWLERSIQLYGEECVNKIISKKIAIFGLGGVGSFAAEAIARSGVGKIFICDSDVFEITNFNRQLGATTDTLNCSKVDVMGDRICKINPRAEIVAQKIFIDENNLNTIKFGEFDYVIDAIDSVDSKVALIKYCKGMGIRIVSAMGARNKTRPEMLQLVDIFDTRNCPLSKIMRQRLKKVGVGSLDVVYSTQIPLKKSTGSSVFVPAAMGIMLAAKVVNDIIFGGCNEEY